MYTKFSKTLKSILGRLFSIFMILAMLFSGVGVSLANAAPSTNALQLVNPTSGQPPQYVSFGQATSTLGTAHFTLELWFKRTDVGTTTTTGTGGLTSVIPLMTKGRGEGDGSNLDCNYFLGIRTTDNVLAADFEDYGTATTGGLNHPIVGVTPIVNNVWYHGAATYDGTKWQLFLNGKLEAELNVGKSPRYDSIQYAGLGTAMTSAGPTGRAGGFAGVLDEAHLELRPQPG